MNRLKRITLLLTAATVGVSCVGKFTNTNTYAELNQALGVEKIPLPKNGFWSGFLDKDGSLWFSSNGGGVVHFDGKTFRRYTEKDGLSSNQVYSITSDKNNNLWFGTQKGLSKYNRKHFVPIPLPYQDTTQGWISTVYPVLNPNAAYSLATDNEDHLWIGTAGGGAYKYDGKNFQPYLTDIGTKYENEVGVLKMPLGYSAQDFVRKIAAISMLKEFLPWLLGFLVGTLLLFRFAIRKLRRA